ncbi:MAG: sulfotransferase family 2 domain-containing protein [Paracoccaceae bacterium]
MIISPGRRYIFVHIPKTGGTALALALEARAMKDDILIGDTPKAVRRRARLKGLRASGRLWKHSRLTDIHGVLSEAAMRDYFVVTLVRNPWDRMVSYYHWLKLQGFDHVAVGLAKSLEFGEFLRHPHVQASIGAAHYASYVTDNSGTEQCNLFARIEHLKTDLAAFETHLGFDIGRLERVNTSPRDADYRGYFSAGDASIIARICATDIARFGYAF